MTVSQQYCPFGFRYAPQDRPVDLASAEPGAEGTGVQAVHLDVGRAAWVQHRDGLFHWAGKLWLNGFTCTQGWADEHFAMSIERVDGGVVVVSWDEEQLRGGNWRRGLLPEHRPNTYRSHAHDLWVVGMPPRIGGW